MRRLLFALFLLTGLAPAQTPAVTPATTPRWSNGLPPDPAFFPLAVWLQAPHNAKRYGDVGINLYLGLYNGPTAEQLAGLEEAGMRVICAQNAAALAHRGPAIVGWLLHDEPDNAQAREGGGWGPPVPPADVAAAYERLHRNDPTRPILVNFGQGAAWDRWYGRGERTNHPEDYREYLKGCDLASFDIYPVTHDHDDVRGKLEFVGRGVQRLIEWSGGKKPVWACIETSHVGNAETRPTPDQVRSEVWIAICSGASGIVYFAHQFAPTFVEAALLEHAESAAAVRELNADVLSAAPVLNTPIVRDAVQVDAGAAQIAVRVHRHGGGLHVFAASLSPEPAKVTFTLRGRTEGKGEGKVEGAGREWQLSAGSFADDISSYGFRRYWIAD